METPEVDAALSAILGGLTADACESATLDFKREGRSRPDFVKAVAEAAACFANAAGGHLVIGVHDRIPGRDALEGTTLDGDQLLRRIYELTVPPVTVEITERLEQSVRLLVVRVPRGPEVHQVDNRATRRIGKSCEPMSATQIASLLAERRGYDWSAEETDRVLTDVDASALQQARTLLRASPDPARRGYADESNEDLLRILGLISTRGTLLRGGEVLLCASEGQAPLVVYQYRRTPSGEPVATRLPGPLLSAFLRTFELVTARLDTTPVNLPGGQQVQLTDLPEAAIREAVANAVVHRDYRLSASVRIDHAPTRLAVVSPGPLVQGVTVDNILTTSSRPRNTRLAAAVRMLGLAEEAGVGVDRMYREMVKVGHNPPIFEEFVDQVRVTLTGGAPNRTLARYVATLPQSETDDADAMLILYSLLTKRVVSASTLSVLLQKPADEVESVLRRLNTDPPGMLEPTRQTLRKRFPNYRLREHVITALGASVTYRRRTTDEYDRKVIELVRETGQINARIVRIALDLETVAASRVLGDLVDRGILTKTSDAQRGPSVTYGPGPSFPRAKPGMQKRPDTPGGHDANPDATGQSSPL